MELACKGKNVGVTCSFNSHSPCKGQLNKIKAEIDSKKWEPKAGSISPECDRCITSNALEMERLSGVAKKNKNGKEDAGEDQKMEPSDAQNKTKGPPCPPKIRITLAHIGSCADEVGNRALTLTFTLTLTVRMRSETEPLRRVLM